MAARTERKAPPPPRPGSASGPRPGTGKGAGPAAGQQRRQLATHYRARYGRRQGS